MITGFTSGSFDMFHVGHLNLIKRAWEQCDKLTIGLNSDEFIYSYKHKYPIIPNSFLLWEKYHFDKLFIGSDYRGSPQYEELDKLLRQVNSEAVVLSYTEGISSSILRKKLEEK